MKIVQKQGLTFIYPFCEPEGELPVVSPLVMACPIGVKLLQVDGILMSAEAGRMLAEALLHATEIAGKGRE